MIENVFMGSAKGDQVALIQERLQKAWIVPIVRIWGSGSIVVENPLTAIPDEIVISIDGDAFHTHFKGIWRAVPVVVDDGPE